MVNGNSNNIKEEEECAIKKDINDIRDELDKLPGNYFDREDEYDPYDYPSTVIPIPFILSTFARSNTNTNTNRNTISKSENSFNFCQYQLQNRNLSISKFLSKYIIEKVIH
jgi:hypothetical protein